MKDAGSILRRVCVPVLAVVLAGVAGCASKQEKALEQAKKQAVATGQPQQIVTVDKSGDTITTIVQPPAPGQKQPTVTTTTTPPPAGMPKPQASGPTISSLAQAAPQQSAQAAPPQVSIPKGTRLAIRVDQTISVKTSRPGDEFTGEIVEPIYAPDNSILVPKGTRVRGRVDAAHRRGRFKGASYLDLRLTAMRLNGTEYPLETREFAESKRGKGRRTAGLIGGGAGLGMLVGGLASGGAGLLWGGLAGGGAGTAAAAFTGNRDLYIPAEAIVHFRLADDLVVQPAQ
ncbi:MAG: hypothetical protein ACLGSD_16415 [Acidobacteriota bacterium]